MIQSLAGVLFAVMVITAIAAAAAGVALWVLVIMMQWGIL